MMNAEIMIGIYRITLTPFLPLNLLFRNSAAARPHTFWKKVEPKPYIIVFSVARQNRLSVKRFTKFFRPYQRMFWEYPFHLKKEILTALTSGAAINSIIRANAGIVRERYIHFLFFKV